MGTPPHSNSSPSSFHTAQSPKSLSSPNSSSTPIGDSKYRSARLLPYELRHHCLIYLEEQLYLNALNLLTNLVVSGSSQDIPLFAPPPSHLALASTLLVHPNHTTRAQTRDALQIPAQSITLLRSTLSILGPINAKLTQAFTFKPKGHVRSKRAGKSGPDNDSGDSDYDEDELKSVLANKSSLWERAQDFWHAVGWSLNCTTAHPQRWRYWKVWLEYMLDVLDADWDERARLDAVEYGEEGEGGGEQYGNLKESLILRYMLGNGSRSHAVKRVVRSIFADGSIESLRVFPEIFASETISLEESKTGQKRKRENEKVVDIDKERYGDYAGEDDFDDDSLSAPRPIALEQAETESTLNNSSTIAIRLRLMAMLSRACDIPEFAESFQPLNGLYELFYEHIRPLPLNQFSKFLSPTALPYFPEVAMSSLAQMHLQRLLPSAANNAMHKMRQGGDDSINQAFLGKCILPFAAATSSAEDNAKVSCLVECLFRMCAGLFPVVVTRDFTAAVEKGIKARRDKAGNEKKMVGRPPTKKSAEKRQNTEEDEARKWMNYSSERIRAVVRFLERSEADSIVVQP